MGACATHSLTEEEKYPTTSQWDEFGNQWIVFHKPLIVSEKQLNKIIQCHTKKVDHMLFLIGIQVETKELESQLQRQLQNNLQSQLRFNIEVPIPEYIKSLCIDIKSIYVVSNGFVAYFL